MPTVQVLPMTDLEPIKALCRDPYIARVGHDYRPAEVVLHPDVRYLGAFVDGEMVGAFMVVNTGWIDFDLHALLTKRALPQCRKLGRLCLDFVFADPIVCRVTANIIQGLESARNYCLKLGFKPEGYKPHACLKNGRPVGVYMLGMTRSEWGGL
jgi:hypothetical protein